MNWILEYSPIFFDFDGLLVNTEYLHYQAYQRMMECYGASFPWDFPGFAGVAHKSSHGLRELITSHAPALVEQESWNTLYSQKTAEYAKLLEAGDLDLMPGAQTILETVQMAKIPHAVVTNSIQEQVEKIRAKIPILDKIPHWITREDYENPKPAPDGYLKATEVLGKSEKMLGFEDSLKGLRALEEASITPVLICSRDHPQMREISKETIRYYPSLSSLFS